MKPAVSAAGAPSKARRWPTIYYLLAAFDVFTVCVSLYLGHLILDLYKSSVNINLEYSERRREITKLDEFATDANAPGNNVFESGDIKSESARLALAVNAFDRQVAHLREDFSKQLSPEFSPPLLAKLLEVEQAFDAMVERSRQIFDAIGDNNLAGAGRHMAAMDRQHAIIINKLGDLRADSRAIEKALFSSQEKDASRLQKLEYVIAFFVLLMVGAATFYGHKLAQQFEADTREKEKYLSEARSAQEELRQSNESLESRVEARTAELAGLNAALAAEVAEGKQTEAALRETEQRYRTLAGMVPVGIFRSDRKHETVFSNRTWTDISGLTFEQSQGPGWMNAVHPEDRARVTSYWFEQANAGKPVKIEYRLLRPDGGIVWVYVQAEQEKDLEGRVTGYVGAITDITERKRSEQALRESEEKWRSAVENAPDIIMTLDRDGKILFINRVVPGLSVEKVIGSSAYEYVPPDARDRLKGYVEQVFKTGEAISYEMVAGAPNGTYAWYSSRLGPVRHDDKVTAAILFVTDVTSQKQAAEALRQSDQRMKMAVEAAKLGTWHWDIEHDVITISPYLTQTAGRLFKQHGKYADFLAILAPEDRAKVDALVQRTITEGVEYNAEYRMIQPDGTMRWLNSRGQVVRDDSGRIIALTGVDMDITERKEAEEERRRLEAQIQHAQKLESLGVLAGGIAHDFNNLLAAMLGNASLALLELPTESPALKSIQNIQTASQRAAELCRQMLAYSGKGKFIVEPISLNRLVEEMGHLLQACISKNALLKYNLAPDIPSCYADATQVRQVIMNLITNASEAIGQKPGTISVSTGMMDANDEYLAGCYPAELPPAGRYLYAEVCDTGCGMNAETLSKIFDPFFSTKFTGRGLGLAAVLGIMRGHRGTIKVTSSPGEGTCFRVLFPCPTHAHPRPTTAHIPIAQWRGSGTVMVVDDEECIRSVTRSILEKFGFKVLSACDGEESIKMLREHQESIAAVILDMTMPRMDGETAFRELRMIRPDLRIILSSGFTEQEIAARFADKPLDGFIQKPYTASDLITKLRAALSSN